VLRYLQDGFDVNSRNAHGEVMLLHAVCMGDARLPIARILIDRGADVNAIVNNKTMLEFIRDPVYCDNEETIALLIARGATERPPASSDADMIRFRCPQCNRRLKANQNAIGKKATCNKCGCKMTVPAAMAATTPPMDELAKALRDTLHDDFEVRIEALAKLRELKNLDAVEPLIRLLEDHDARIRQETAYTLESLGDSRAVMPLISAMRDLDGDVRLKVARALGVLKHYARICLIRTTSYASTRHKRWDESAMRPHCPHSAPPWNRPPTKAPIARWKARSSRCNRRPW
jgi:hypothetical protein